jgi:hypothetical protein
VVGEETFEPIDLPEFAGTDALVGRCLVVLATCHGSAVDRVDDSVWGEVPPIRLVRKWMGIGEVGGSTFRISTFRGYREHLWRHSHRLDAHP